MTTITTDNGEEFFLIDPRHEDFVREDSLQLKDRRLTWLQRFMLVALVVASGWLLAGQLLAETVRAEATILELAEGPDIDAYFAVYSFVAQTPNGDEAVTIEEKIDYTVFERIEVGDVLTVQYRPDDVETARIIELTPATINENSLLLFVTLILIGSALYVLIFWIIRPDNRNRLLEREGMLIRGKINNVYPRKLPRRYIVNVSFEFPLPDGKVIEAEASHNRRDLEENILPRPGAKVLVLYVNEKTLRLM